MSSTTNHDICQYVQLLNDGAAAGGICYIVLSVMFSDILSGIANKWLLYGYIGHV